MGLSLALIHLIFCKPLLSFTVNPGMQSLLLWFACRSAVDLLCCRSLQISVKGNACFVKFGYIQLRGRPLG